jgi:endonuclease/exonuclease/phosphatase family metal-dependent hydrolase
MHRGARCGAMTRLRVATWNIHAAVGIDRRYAPERIARVLAEIDADLIALQEFSARRGNADDLRKHCEDATAARAIVTPTFLKHGRAFGNALLCRLPVVAEHRHDLAVGRSEPRNAIEAIVDFSGEQLHVFATHLGLRAAERRQQVAWLCDALSSRTNVLLGDFNEWRRSGCLAPLEQALACIPSPPTFPSPCPVAPLDRILATRSLACREIHVHRSLHARVASDHLPLVATFEWA